MRNARGSRKHECGYYYEDDTAHPELPKQHGFCQGADRLALRRSSEKQVAKFYFRALRLTSTARRRRSAFSNWFTRLVRSASCLSKAIIRPRAKTLTSATKKEPSPLAIARPLVAEVGAIKSINEVKESKLAVNAKATLRANAAIKTGRKRRASPATPKLCRN